MGERDPRVDAYIARAAPFARPILEEIRERVHEGFPEIEEEIKWGAPAFMHHGIVANMAAFKAHCAFGFWNQAVVSTGKEKEAMGHYGRIASVADLPPKRDFLALVKKAALANASGEKRPRVLKHPRKPAPAMPDDFRQALARNVKAKRTYDSFSPSHQREYLEWITEARQESTRERRLATSIEWLSDGKSRMWRYQTPKIAAAAAERKPAQVGSGKKPKK
jgi:uncharacterized protein YdeI (YjbR/CyaY-like superfamily)